MSASWTFMLGFGVGMLVCLFVLTWPVLRLCNKWVGICNRWMAFYADDIKAAKERAAEPEQAPVPVEPKTGAVN